MLTEKEKKVFADAFYLGFMVAFDGWNGETFSLCQRMPEDSEILVERMNAKRKVYENEQCEKAKLFPIGCNSPIGSDDSGEFVCTGI